MGMVESCRFLPALGDVTWGPANCLGETQGQGYAYGRQAGVASP